MHEKIKEVNREKENEVKEVKIEFADLEKKLEEAIEVMMDKRNEEWEDERNEWKTQWEEYSNKKEEEIKKLRRELELFCKKGIYDRGKNNWK